MLWGAFATFPGSRMVPDPGPGRKGSRMDPGWIPDGSRMGPGWIPDPGSPRTPPDPEPPQIAPNRPRIGKSGPKVVSVALGQSRTARLSELGQVRHTSGPA